MTHDVLDPRPHRRQDTKDASVNYDRLGEPRKSQMSGFNSQLVEGDQLFEESKNLELDK